MLNALPLGTFLLLVLYLWAGPAGQAGASGPRVRQALLLSALVCGAYLAISSELLSLFTALDRQGVAATWALALLLTLGVIGRGRSLPHALARWRSRQIAPPDAGDLLLVSLMVLFGGALLVIACVSPPNNTDSLQYHLSRVAHWTQNASLRHYPTTYEPQLFLGPWAEEAILHLRLLGGNDRLANLVQWLAMVGSLVGASAIAAELGAGRRAQILAACFAFSIPAGILESTSTQNDHVAAFWLVCLAYLTVRLKRESGDRSAELGWAFALGLGLLTKASLYPCAVPFVLWRFWPILRRSTWRRTFASALTACAVVVVLNAGFWGRNLATYGNPLGSPDYVSGKLGGGYAPSAVVYRTIRSLALNLATPSEPVNRWLVERVRWTAERLGGDPAEFDLVWAWNNENLAGNPIHMLVAGVTAMILGVRLFRRGFSIELRYAAAALASLALLLGLLAFDLYGVRHQLLFLVVWSPLVGILVTGLGRRWSAACGLLLVVLSLPWVLWNASRPLIGWKPRTMIDSVLVEPAEAILFANWTQLRDPFHAATAAVSDLGCQEVGLRLESSDLEYAFWWLLGAPESGRRIEHVDPYPHLAGTVDPAFRPCAILCTICQGRDRLHGLPRLAEFDGVTLYAGQAFSPDIDG